MIGVHSLIEITIEARAVIRPWLIVSAYNREHWLLLAVGAAVSCPGPRAGANGAFPGCKSIIEGIIKGVDLSLFASSPNRLSWRPIVLSLPLCQLRFLFRPSRFNLPALVALWSSRAEV